jgi:hypothetical protein
VENLKAAGRVQSGVPPLRLPKALVLLALGVVCFDAALWMPCISEGLVQNGAEADVYSGAHLIFVAVGSLYSMLSSAFAPDQQLESWWLLPIANAVFLAAPWVWTAHPRSRTADRGVIAIKIATAILGVWAVANFVLAHTGLWAEPVVQTAISLVPSTPWQLESGALMWALAMVFVSAALIHRRGDQRALLSRWDSRPGADALQEEPTPACLSGLPAGVQGLVIDAHRLRLEFDTLGPIDGWRVRLIGDWLGRLHGLSPGDRAALETRNILPEQFAIAVYPDTGAQRESAGSDRLAELLRVDEALHHFIAAALTPPARTYR